MSNQWGTMTFAIPDFLEDTREAINSVMELLVTVLDIALTALQFAKAFLVGYLDPIASLIKQILDEVNGMLQDLQQVGLYMTGDWDSLDFPFDDLRGGFQEYERRMIGRLTDRTDASRPDLSAKTKVMAMYFYLSVDMSEVERLIEFIKDLLRFFRQRNQSVGSYPIPIITDVLVGGSGASVLRPQDLGAYFTTSDSPPDVVVVKWKATSPQKNPMNPFPALPPGGFMVTVSTLKDGLPVYYTRPQGDSTEEKTPKGGKQQPQEQGVVRTKDGKPLVLFGGHDHVYKPEAAGYNQSTESGGVAKPVRARVFGAVRPTDNTIIPLDQLQVNGTNLFQKTFYVPLESVGSQWAMGEYSLTLKAKDMPLAGQITDNDGQMTGEGLGTAGAYYVRVASCTKFLGNGVHKYQWDMEQLETTIQSNGPVRVALRNNVPESAISEWSEPREINFPGANTKKYLEALETALVVLVLSRPDLTPVDQIKEVVSDEMYTLIQNSKVIIENAALQRCGLEPFVGLVEQIYEDYASMLKNTGESPIDFRQFLLGKVKQVARDIYKLTGPMPDIEAFVVQQSKTLRTETWGTIFGGVSGVSKGLVKNLGVEVSYSTILGSLDPDEGGGIIDSGVSMTPYNMGLTAEVSADLFKINGLVQLRLPQMQEGNSAPSEGFNVKLTATKAEMAELETSNPGLQVSYEKFIQADGSMVVPEKYQEQLVALKNSGKFKRGSADLSPVFAIGVHDMESLNPNIPITKQQLDTVGVFYCRGVFAGYKSGKIFTETAAVLSMAASVLQRPPLDGKWLSLRFLDTMPALEDFMTMILNWVEALSSSIQSILDTILKYIEFIEGRLVELQQFIQRINQLIQTLLGFSFQIPKCSFLLTVSNGTDGAMTDLVAAENKPPDSPLAFGGGVAVLIPFGPAFAMDIIKAIMVADPGVDPPPVTQGLTSSPAGSPIPLPVEPEVLPPLPPPDPEPDVL